MGNGMFGGRQEGRDSEWEVGGGGGEEHSGKSPAVRQIRCQVLGVVLHMPSLM